MFWGRSWRSGPRTAPCAGGPPPGPPGPAPGVPPGLPPGLYKDFMRNERIKQKKFVKFQTVRASLKIYKHQNQALGLISCVASAFDV